MTTPKCETNNNGFFGRLKTPSNVSRPRREPVIFEDYGDDEEDDVEKLGKNKWHEYKWDDEEVDEDETDVKKLGDDELDEDELDEDEPSEKGFKIKYTRRLYECGEADPMMCSITWDGFLKHYGEPIPFGKLTLQKHLTYRASNDTTKKQLSDSERLNHFMIPGIFKRPKTTMTTDLKALHLLVLKIDDKALTLSMLAKILRSMQLECLIHTSFFNDKFMVYIPFNKPLTVRIEETCSRALDWFKSRTVLGDYINDDCWCVNEEYYYKPACPPDAVGLYKYRYIRGKFFMIDNFKVDKVDPNMFETGKGTYDNKVVKDFESRTNWREKWNNILSPEGFAYFFTGSSGDRYYMGVKKQRNTIIGTLSYKHNAFYVEKRAKNGSSLKIGRAYSPFEAFRIINYLGDEAGAIRALKSEGYGKPQDSEVEENTGDVLDIYWADERVHEHKIKKRRIPTPRQREIFGDYD